MIGQVASTGKKSRALFAAFRLEGAAWRAISSVNQGLVPVQQRISTCVGSPPPLAPSDSFVSVLTSEWERYGRGTVSEERKKTLLGPSRSLRSPTCGDALIACVQEAARAPLDAIVLERLEVSMVHFQEYAASCNRDLDVRSVNAAMRAAVLLGRKQQALEMFSLFFDNEVGEGRASSKLDPDCYSYNIAISACRGLSSKELDPSVKDGASGRQLRGRGQKHTGAQEALRLVRDMENRYDTASAYRSAAASGPTAHMNGNGNAVLSLEAYGSALSVLCETKFSCQTHCRHALELLDTMQERGVEPDIRIIESILVACGWAGEWKNALRLLHRLGEAHQMRSSQIPATQSAVSISSCIAALNACARASPVQWEEAMSLLRAMEASQEIHRVSPSASNLPNPLTTILPLPDVRAYAVAMNALSRGGQWERTVALLDEIENRGHVATNEYIYAAAIAACANSSKFRRGSKMVRASGASVFSARSGIGNRSQAYIGAERARCLTALRLLSRMKDRCGLVPDGACFSAALAACASAGQWRDALIVLDQMDCSFAGEVKNSTESEKIGEILVSYGHAVAACAKYPSTRLNMNLDESRKEAKELTEASDAALQLLARLQLTYGLKPTPRMTLTGLNAAANAGNVMAALKLLKQLVDEARIYDTDRHTSRARAAFAAAVRACDTAAQPLVALAILDNMLTQPFGIKPDLATFNVAINAAGVAGAWKRACGLYLELRLAKLTGDETTFRTLAKAMHGNKCSALVDSTYCEAVASGVVWPWIDPLDSNLLDLHGMSAPLAQAALRVAVGDMIRRQSRLSASYNTSDGFSQAMTNNYRLVPSPSRDLVLITGTARTRGPLGSPSLGMSALKPALGEALESMVDDINKQRNKSLCNETNIPLKIEFRECSNSGRIILQSSSLLDFTELCVRHGIGPLKTIPLLRDIVDDDAQKNADKISPKQQSTSSMKRLRQIQRLKRQLSFSLDPFQL